MPPSSPRARRRHWPRITRDGVLFVAGLGGLLYETIIHEGDPRDTLLIVFAAMIGLPAFLRTDESGTGRRNRDGGR